MNKALVAGIAGIALLVAGVTAYKYDEWFVFSNNRPYILEKLRDPDSTQFRKEFMHGANLCGELNSKNGSGGYSGFKRFIAANPDYVFIEGHEPLVKLSHQDYLLRLQTQNDILREYLAVKEQAPSIEMPSKYHIEEQTEQRFFEKLWKENCG